MFQFFRSIIFNILFFGLTAFLCFALLWTALLPRKAAMAIYRAYFKLVYYMECVILGLSIRVEGLEHLPADGKYIIAAKHQSAHETMMFPVILNDPAIIMKKELMNIPLWGWYAKKAEMIGVDRSAKSKALESMVKGAQKVFDHNRPVIIFPQGTRTHVTQSTKERPYKGGLSRIYASLNCPVVPMALNTGVFWGRNAFIKKAGVATLRFLPPLEADLPPKDMLRQLETTLENESDSLVQEAQNTYAAQSNRRAFQDILFFFAMLFCAWSAYWLWSARLVENAMLDLRLDLQQEGPLAVSYGTSHISGYPFAVKLHINDIKIHSPSVTASIPALTAKAIPLPGRSLFIHSTAPITLQPAMSADQEQMDFMIDSLKMEIAHVIPPFFTAPPTETLTYNLRSMALQSGPLTITAQGKISQSMTTMRHDGEILFVLDGYQDYMLQLINDGYVKRVPAMFFMSMLQNQSQEWLKQARVSGRLDIPDMESGVLALPLSIKDDVIYAGMFQIAQIGDPNAVTTEQPVSTIHALPSALNTEEEMDIDAPESILPSVNEIGAMPPSPSSKKSPLTSDNAETMDNAIPESTITQP